MISSNMVMSIVRKTDNLKQVKAMYQQGLGLDVLDEFRNIDGYDGVVLGHPEYGYTIEFTDRPYSKPYQLSDCYIVFHIGDTQKWELICRAMIRAGFKFVEARNPYWTRVGKTFEDPDGYRVVIQNGELRMRGNKK